MAFNFGNENIVQDDLSRAFSMDEAAVCQMTAANLTSAAFSGVRPRSWQLSSSTVGRPTSAVFKSPMPRRKSYKQHPTLKTNMSILVPSQSSPRHQWHSINIKTPVDCAPATNPTVEPDDMLQVDQAPHPWHARNEDGTHPLLPSCSPTNTMDCFPFDPEGFSDIQAPITGPDTEQFPASSAHLIERSTQIGSSTLFDVYPSPISHMTAYNPSPGYEHTDTVMLTRETGPRQFNRRTPVDDYGTCQGINMRCQPEQADIRDTFPMTMDLISPEASPSSSPIPVAPHTAIETRRPRPPPSQSNLLGLATNEVRHMHASNRQVPAVSPQLPLAPPGPASDATVLNFPQLNRRLQTFIYQHTQTHMFGTQEYNRVRLLEQAVKERDYVFLVIHQLCSMRLWPIGLVPHGVRDAGQASGCNLFLQMTVGNEQIGSDTLRLFADFPYPMESTSTDLIRFAGNFEGAARFLHRFGGAHAVLLHRCIARRFPPLIQELLNHLHMASQILQQLTFRSIRRSMFPEYQDDEHSTRLDHVFQTSQRHYAEYQLANRLRQDSSRIAQQLLEVPRRYLEIISARDNHLLPDGTSNYRLPTTQLPPSPLVLSQPEICTQLMQNGGYAIGQQPVDQGITRQGPISRVSVAHLPRNSTTPMEQQSVANFPTVSAVHTSSDQTVRSLSRCSPAVCYPSPPQILSSERTSRVIGKALGLPLQGSFAPVPSTINNYHPRPSSRPISRLNASHPVDVNGPILAPADVQTERGQRLHRMVTTLLVDPWMVAVPRAATVNKAFEIPNFEADVKKSSSHSRGAPLRYLIKEGAKLYRIRCIKISESERFNLSHENFFSRSTVWPANLTIKLNTKKLGIRRKTYHGPDLPADVTSILHDGKNFINIHHAPNTKIVSEGANRFHYAFGIELVVVTSSSEIMRMAVANPFRAEEVLAQICAHLCPVEANSQSDDLAVLAPESLILSIRDPLSQRVIKLPARSRACAHRECFDLETFISSRRSLEPVPDTEKPWENRPSSPEHWRCPICKADARPALLGVDEWLKGVIQEIARRNSNARMVSPRTTEYLEKDGRDIDMDGGTISGGRTGDNEDENVEVNDDAEAIIIKADGSWRVKLFEIKGLAAGNCTSPDAQAIDAMNLDSPPLNGRASQALMEIPTSRGQNPNPVVIDLLDDD